MNTEFVPLFEIGEFGESIACKSITSTMVLSPNIVSGMLVALLDNAMTFIPASEQKEFEKDTLDFFKFSVSKRHEFIEIYKEVK